MTVRKAIIPCAGFGTRFLPATKALPKELLPIVDIPALSYIVDEAENSGIEEVMIVISPQKQQIKRLFSTNKTLNALLKARGDEEEFALANKKRNAKIRFITQREMNGNANAILLCKEFAAGEPVAVLFGDDVMYTGDGEPVTRQLIDAYELTGATIVGCQETSEEVARKCGVMITGNRVSNKIYEIHGVIEKPQGELPSGLVSLGRFILTPNIFDVIEKTPKTAGEVYLTEAIDLLAKEGGKVCSCKFDARRYDIGDKLGYLEAVTDYALRDPKLQKRYLNYIKQAVETTKFD